MKTAEETAKEQRVNDLRQEALNLLDQAGERLRLVEEVEKADVGYHEYLYRFYLATQEGDPLPPASWGKLEGKYQTLRKAYEREFNAWWEKWGDKLYPNVGLDETAGIPDGPIPVLQLTRLEQALCY
jgi:hypothetical protein